MCNITIITIVVLTLLLHEMLIIDNELFDINPGHYSTSLCQYRYAIYLFILLNIIHNGIQIMIKLL